MEPIADQVWFSSATAALIAALEAVGARNKHVALPPNVCPNVVAAIRAVDATPMFVDIENERAGLDPPLLQQACRDVGCVIAVHAYGIPCRIDEIATWTRAAGIPLIEDCAQAEGGSYKGRAVGDFGDIAVFSFGTGKIVDAGGGGLALVRDRRLHRRMLDIAEAWPETDNAVISESLSRAYKHIYNRHYPDVPPEQKVELLATIERAGPQFVGRLPRACLAPIENTRATLPQRIATRRNKHKLYASLLSDMPGYAPEPLPEGGVPWRFNMLLPAESRDRVFRALLAMDIKASTWYPDFTRFLPPTSYAATSLEVARQHDGRILNLWLDESESETLIRRSVAQLRELAALA